MADDRLDGHTILLVEDEPFILMEIMQVLQEAGARVVCARTIEEALGALQVETITVSVLDYKLQGRTADDLCQQLTERKIPFVIYSGYPNVEGECSRWEIVPKPADPRMLVTCVLSVLVANALREGQPTPRNPQ